MSSPRTPLLPPSARHIDDGYIQDLNITGEDDTTQTAYLASTDATESSRHLSPDDVLNFIGLGWFQAIAFVLAGFAFFSYGMDVSVFIFITKSVEAEWNLTNLQYAVLPSVTSVPNIIGALVFGFLGDSFGRVWPLALALLLCGVFGMFTALAPNFPALIAIRVFCSLGIGAIQSLTIPFLLEFLPVRNRGKVMILIVIIPAVGLCVSCGLAWWLITSYPENGWRYYVIAAGAPSIFVAAFRMIFFFQSPRFLLAKGRVGEAWKVFEVMAKTNRKDLTSFINESNFQLAFCKFKQQRESRIIRVVTLGKNFLSIFSLRYLRRTLSLSVLMFTQALGFLGSTLFLPGILTDLGENLYFSIMVSFIAQIPGVLLMSIIVEWPRVGRLNSLRFFSASVVLFFLLFAFIRSPIATPVFLVFLYFCMLPILSLLYTYIGESYPTDIRNVSTAFFYIIQAICGLIYPFVSGYLASKPIPWLYPVVWAGVFLVQFIAGLVLNYEPYSQALTDVVST